MQRQQPYRSDIDGFRCIAVLAVLIFHLEESWLPGGYLGVDIFFVISGYVVTGSLQEGTSIVEFYKRRLRRLYPALLTCLIITAIATAILLPSSMTGTIYRSGIAATLGASNLFFYWTSANYFALLGNLNPFAQTWSLGVEEQFYLIYPALFLLLRKTWQPFATILLISGVIAAATIYWSEQLGFYTLLGRFWQLFLGAFLFQIRSNRRQSWLGYIGLALVAYSLVFPSTLAATLGAALMIHGGVPSLSFRPLVSIGLISYSLYLYHWPVFTFIRWHSDLTENAFLAIAMTSVLAITSYRYVERPIRRSDVRPLVMIGSSAICVAIMFALAVPLRGSLYAGEHKPESQWLASEVCHSPKTNDPIGLCLSRKNDEPTIFLIGDSHAGNLSLPLRAIAERSEWSFHQMTGRALAYGLTGRRGCGGDTSCQDDEVAVHQEFIRSMLPGDLLVFSMYSRRLDQATKFEIKRLVNAIPKGVNMLVVDDTPYLDVNFVQCVFGSSDDCSVPLSRARALRQRLTKALKATEAIYVDPFPVFCRESRCSLFDEFGELMYTDSRFHLTSKAAMRLEPLLHDVISEIATTAYPSDH